ncbi:hypothetical protein NCLIV_028160 [Neospora caninum Liverpool]|uniref:Chromodomain helicase DNA binding protein CHD1/SWI2/SNF2 n=1 Tax=Neospora caninum (strain Liverpool) TaxID=572307 RepID=F0VH33_NEOCL|nr:hypothetical protein NCLIV_028160 [Neospora caninum Liverpool]CBZ53027.1 hypothetical protein NCLIV_028160 [Neospora caninum Liverpool]CEL67011.1 TPA: chromodomain helicase DNA binding protein CHD1/SWI2/SNF2 [Neospora caninum Liverpool]|eukprot:XP_003883059.1 hypothetical protein NCLIV_028160 [Neospora caninum Liverpool]
MEELSRAFVGAPHPSHQSVCQRQLEGQGARPGAGFAGLMSAAHQPLLPSSQGATSPPPHQGNSCPGQPAGAAPTAGQVPNSLQFHLKHLQNAPSQHQIPALPTQNPRGLAAPHLAAGVGAKPQSAAAQQQLLLQRHQLLLQQRVQQDHLRFQHLHQQQLMAQHGPRGPSPVPWPGPQATHVPAAPGVATPGSFAPVAASATQAQLRPPLASPSAHPPPMASLESQTAPPNSRPSAESELRGQSAGDRDAGPSRFAAGGSDASLGASEDARRTGNAPSASPDAVGVGASGVSPSGTVAPAGAASAQAPAGPGESRGATAAAGFQPLLGNKLGGDAASLATAMQRQRQLLQHQQLLQFQHQAFAHAQASGAGVPPQRAPGGPNGVGPGFGFFGAGDSASQAAGASNQANPLLQQQLLQQQLQQLEQAQQNPFLNPQLLQLQQLQRQNMYLRHLQQSAPTSYGFPSSVMTPPTAAAAAAAAALAASAAKTAGSSSSAAPVQPYSRRSAAAAAAARMRQFAAAENATDDEFFDAETGPSRSPARRAGDGLAKGGSRSKRSRQQSGRGAEDDGYYYASHSISRQNSGVGSVAETGGVQLRQRRATARSGRYSEMLDDDDEEDDFVEEDDDEEDSGRRRRTQQRAAAASCRAQQLQTADAQQAGGVDRVLDSRVNEDGTEEFFIKWLGRSHLHNSWMTYEELMPLLGIKKVDNFIKRREKRQQAAQWMTPDELEQQEIERQMQRQMDEDALIAERLLCKWQDQATGEWLYIVKWRSCPYDQCTQETEKALLEHNFGHLMEELDARTERINRKVAASMQPGAFRPITATPFSPYLETPFYMRREATPDPDGVGDDEEEDEKGEAQKPSGGTGGEAAASATNGAAEPQDEINATQAVSKREEVRERPKGEEGDPGDGPKVEKEEASGEGMQADQKGQALGPVKSEGKSEGPQNAGSPAPRQVPTSSSPGASPSQVVAGESEKAGLKRKTQVLRDYQMFGVNWILSRLKRGVSVLLADEMGLGKTVQTIGVTGHLLFREHSLKPILIFAPQSTIDNWMREFQRWLPQANVVCFHGNASAREIIKNYELQRVSQQRSYPPVFKFDVCLTTPSILNCAADAEYLKRIQWGLLVVDEAHQLKNINSKRFIELSLFLVDHKLFLSGTPLHNNLEELWNLLHFLNPNIHRDCAEFKARYHLVENHAEVGEQKTGQLAALQAELNGFILRRVKKDVEKSMPKKVESILRVEMSPLQLKFYRLILTKNFDLLAKKGGGNRSSLQNICMELKKVCNHPFLCQSPDEEEDGEEWRRLLVDGSAKMGLLDKLLKRLKEKGHRVLIFSQMRLDGTMAKEVRRKAMEHFNAKNSEDFCFLLSTKAGGLGINLTSADTVIIFDSDWNPQNDLQAEARAHRIGQTRTVQIYRLVTKDSIEQTILERAKAKMVLDTLVVQGLNQRSLEGGAGLGAGGLSLTRDDLSRILKFGASKLWKQSQPKGCEDVQGKAEEEEPSGEKDEQKEVDLDLILAEAEVTVTEAGAGGGSGGLADSLLSSYQNIQEFKYEPTAPAKTKGRGRGGSAAWSLGADGEAEAVNDADFWQKCIPEEERLKMKKNKEEELIVYGKRKTRNNLFIGQLLAGGDAFGSPSADPFGSGNLSERSRRGEGKGRDFTQDEASDVSASGPFGAGVSASTPSSVHGNGALGSAVRERRGRGSRRLVSPTSLTDKELHRLYRAMLKYGSPSVRTDDIIFDARLDRVEKEVVLSTSQHIMSLCQKRLQEEIVKQSARGSGRRGRRAAGGDGAGEEEDEEGRANGEGDEDGEDGEEKGAVKEGGRRESSYFTRLGDTRVNAFDLVERQHLLTLLHRVLCDQNPQTAEPWKLPTGPLPLPRAGPSGSPPLSQRDGEDGKGRKRDGEKAEEEAEKANAESEKANAESEKANAESEKANAEDDKLRREDDQRGGDGEEETKEGAGGGRHAAARIDRIIREEVHGQGFLKLDLPSRVMSRLKNWSARDVQKWGEAEDRNLLIGAYKYGFGAWLDVCNDPNLELPQIRQIKFDKLKMRALRTLKLLEQDLQHEVGKRRRPRLPQRGNPERGGGSSDSPADCVGGSPQSLSGGREEAGVAPSDAFPHAREDAEGAPGDNRGEGSCGLRLALGDARGRREGGRDEEEEDDEDDEEDDDDERPKKRKKADKGHAAGDEERKRKKKSKDVDAAGLAMLQGEDLRRACKKLLRSVKKKMKNLKKMKKDPERTEPGADDLAGLESLTPLLLPIGEAIIGIVRSLKDQGQPESLCEHVAGGCWQYVASLTAFSASQLSQAFAALSAGQPSSAPGALLRAGSASPSSLQSSHTSYSSRLGDGYLPSPSGFPSAFPPECAEHGTGPVSLRSEASPGELTGQSVSAPEGAVHVVHADASSALKPAHSVSSPSICAKGFGADAGGVSAFPAEAGACERAENAIAQATSFSPLSQSCGPSSSLAANASAREQVSEEAEVGGEEHVSRTSQMEVDDPVSHLTELSEAFGGESGEGRTEAPSRLLSPCRSADANCPLSGTSTFGNVSNVAGTS